MRLRGSNSQVSSTATATATRTTHNTTTKHHDTHETKTSALPPKPQYTRPKSLQKPITSSSFSVKTSTTPASTAAARKRATSSVSQTNIRSSFSTIGPPPGSRDRPESLISRRPSTRASQESKLSDRERPRSATTKQAGEARTSAKTTTSVNNPAHGSNNQTSGTTPKITRRNTSAGSITQSSLAIPPSPTAARPSLLKTQSSPAATKPTLQDLGDSAGLASFSYRAASILSPPRQLSPAHFSSNGVPTSTGPPPSLAYQRKLAMEQHRRKNSGTPMTPGYSNRYGTGSVPGHRLSNPPQFQESSSSDGPESRRNSDRFGFTSPNFSEFEDEEEYDKDRTIRGLEDIKPPPAPAPVDGAADGEDSKDIFLSLADAASERSERRKVRQTTASHF